MDKPCKIYAVFHLNLAFSSLDESTHCEVINQCYWPLLNLIEKYQLPIGIELTAYTLERINGIDPLWVNKFRKLLAEQICELIASGDSQIIGPLIPFEVNRQNLRLGQQYYQQLLGVTPKLAYINEQAVSAGLLDAYLDTGFDAVVLEWDNPYSHNPNWPSELQNRPQHAISAQGRKIKVVWNQAIAFQKFQRFAHGEMIEEDYLAYLAQAITTNCQTFPIYGSDAEIFDYRPGRYKTEERHSHQEWQRIETLCCSLLANPKYRWVLPVDTLEDCDKNSQLHIAVPAHPISVKKQAKYNVTRWALSGRDDLRLNSHCFAKYDEIIDQQQCSDAQWRALCRLWASDYRTHLTAKRYEQLIASIPAANSYTLPQYTAVNSHQLYQISHDEQRNKLSISSANLHIIFNANRGMTIESLAFSDHGFIPVSGTLTHGHFDHISFGADFYSNHLVLERFRQRDRVTDLAKTSWQFEAENDALIIRVSLDTANGRLNKWYRLEGQTVQCGFAFEQNSRPEASLRLGYITLLNSEEPCWFAAHNGGADREHFIAAEDIDHGKPVSSIVSSNSALGATTGEVLFGNSNNGVRICWQPSLCAALPMVSSKKINGKYLNRLWFSLIEADETLKPGGYLPSFSYTLSPTSNIAED